MALNCSENHFDSKQFYTIIGSAFVRSVATVDALSRKDLCEMSDTPCPRCVYSVRSCDAKEIDQGTLNELSAPALREH